MYHFTQRNTRVILSFYFTQFTFQQLPEILKLTSPLQSIQSYQMFFLLSWSRSECSFTYSANCQGQTSESKTAILMENHKSVTKQLPQRQKVLEYSFIHSNVSCSWEWLLLLLNWWNSVCCWKNMMSAGVCLPWSCDFILSQYSSKKVLMCFVKKKNELDICLQLWSGDLCFTFCCYQSLFTN